MFNAGILTGVVLEALNRELADLDGEREFRLEGDSVYYVNTLTGEEKEVTISSLLKALDGEFNASPGLDLEALAEKTAHKVLEKLSSAEYTVPIKVDASALKGLFRQ